MTYADMAILAGIFISLSANAGQAIRWLMGRRSRRITEDHATVDLVNRALQTLETSQKAVTRMTEELTWVQTELGQVRTQLAACVRAREESKAERLVMEQSYERAQEQIDELKHDLALLRGLPATGMPLVAESTVTTTLRGADPD